jgi:hypothetical protein
MVQNEKCGTVCKGRVVPVLKHNDTKVGEGVEV